MKILKIKIQRDQTSEKTHYTYPDEYDASKIQIICYETTNIDNITAVKNRGNDYEYCVGVVKDEDVGIFLESSDIEEIDYDTSILTCDSWVKKHKIIKDPKKVASITVKMLNNETITEEEKKIIDPNNETIGINLTKSFKQKLDVILN